LIHIYTGKGKGKTTSSFGLAMRASGQGLKVIIFQFLKPKSIICGEEISAKKIKNIKIVKFEQTHPMFRITPIAQSALKKSIKKMFSEVEKVVLSGKYDMVILDEIINACGQNFICKGKICELLKKAPKDLELVLTGRGDVSMIEDCADYVTIMVDKKHPLNRGINARKGIEY